MDTTLILPKDGPVREVSALEDVDGVRTWIPTEEELGAVKKLASLRYKPSSIAHVLKVPAEVFMRALSDKAGRLWQEYENGKIESEGPLRQTVLRAASAGEEWAVKQWEEWKQEQLKEELGF